MMKFLLNPKNKYITKGELDDLNRKISGVKFPHDFKGKVTDVTQERLVRMKASEMQLFLLHVLLPLLKPILEVDVFVHHSLFVTAMQVLNQDICNDKDITNAQIMLDQYHRGNTELFERRQMTYTNHALIHLPEQRRQHGCPLVLMSNFVFEE